MNEVTLVDLTKWVGTPIAQATAALAKSGIEVVAQPQQAGPFGPLTTLASSAVQVFAGDQVIALVTSGLVAGFQPAPSGVGSLDHRVAVLEREVATLEVRPAPAAKTTGAGAATRPAADAVKAPARKAPAKKAPAKKTPHRRGQG